MQVRKNLFPPRPKRNRKRRSSLKSKATASSISSTLGSEAVTRRTVSDVTPQLHRGRNSSSILGRRHRIQSASSLRHSAGESSNSEDIFSDTDLESSHFNESVNNSNFLRKSPRLKSRTRRQCDRKKNSKIQDSNNSAVQEKSEQRSESPQIVSIPFERTHMTMTLSMPITRPVSPRLFMSSDSENPSQNISKNNLDVDMKINSSRDNNSKKRKLSSCDNINKIESDDDEIKKKKYDQIFIKNKHLDNVKFSEKSFILGDEKSSSAKKCLNLNVVRDSGFSSCGSSHELSPTISNDFCSQETYCTEVEMPFSTNEPDSQDTVDGGLSGSQDLGSIKSTDSNLTTHSSLFDDNINDEPGSLPMSLSSPVISANYDSDLHSFPSSSSNTFGHTVSDSGIAASVINTESSFTQCMMCLTEPKNGVFVHNNFLHLCCCYKCAMKTWAKSKRCPVCNCKVKNVMKLYVH